MWLFFVQHQFPGAYWERQEKWNYVDAARKGSSFYDLPPLLRYLSGNVGYHHIHHLSPRVPNYRLAACHAALPDLGAPRITLRQSVRCVDVKLIDDATLEPIAFPPLRLRSRKAP